MKRVLLVDDEQRMLDLLALYLKPHHYVCTKVLDGKAALAQLKEKAFDIALIDIMLPELNGWDLCKQIRSKSDIPIIMVTAREQKKDIVRGLKLGADDYITKPIHEEELLARMEALLRRRAPLDIIKINGLLWNEKSYQLSYNDELIKLTPKEFAMLGKLMKNPNLVFSREQIIESIWDFDSETEGRTVDSHVRNMREKIRQTGFPVDQHLLTVWGIGYKWVNE